MSMLTAKHEKPEESNIDYKPAEGWVAAQIVAIADLGEEEFKGELKKKMGVMFAIDETLNLGEDSEVVCKSVLNKYNVPENPFFEKAGIIKNLAKPAKFTFSEQPSLVELLGMQCRVKLEKSDTGKGPYITMVDEPDKKNPFELTTEMYVPKFWLVDAQGKPTGIDICTIDNGLVKAELWKKEEMYND